MANPQRLLLRTKMRASYTKSLNTLALVKPRLSMMLISFAWSKMFALMLELRLKKHKIMLIIIMPWKMPSKDFTLFS